MRTILRLLTTILVLCQAIRIRSGLERDFLVANRLFVNANKANDRLAANATISLAIGDSDTGFDWASDGVYKIKSDRH